MYICHCILSIDEDEDENEEDENEEKDINGFLRKTWLPFSLAADFDLVRHGTISP